MTHVGADGGKRRTGLRVRLFFVYEAIIVVAFGRGWPDEVGGVRTSGAFGRRSHVRGNFRPQ
jgi:hypothetical protein